MTRLRTVAGACALFIVFTVAMTWPQARHLASEAVPHQDVYFNMWRLEWFAHAMRTAPARLFDANIFYPERRTLALSDAMIVEGAVASPLIWAGIRPVLVHNLMMLGGVALSGAAMFALGLSLTGSRGAGLIAGAIFAFAPYRVEHAMHMELQWAMWMPLAFLALHRAFLSGRPAWGVAAGGFVALQMLSSVYYGIFLAALLAVAGVLLLAVNGRRTPRGTLIGLAAGAGLAAVICGAYSRPYVRAHARTGDRPVAEVTSFSATPKSYVVATPGNLLYGRWHARWGGPERRLFPGFTALVLALIGMLVSRRRRITVLYLILLALAFDASLGFGGVTFGFLYQWIGVFHGLRAMARLGIAVLLCLGVLAGCGYRALVETAAPSTRRVTCSPGCSRRSRSSIERLPS